MAWGDLSAAIASFERAYRACRLCPRDCGVNRLEGAPGAQCRLGRRAWVYKELLSHGEESVLGPTWLVDLSGCSLRCVFCSEHLHVQSPRAQLAVALEPAWFTEVARRRVAAGARSLTLVGGEPTVNALGVLEALDALPPALRLPVVWNTNGWMSGSSRAALADLVTCWSVDLKFGGEACAGRLAGTGALAYLPAVYETLDFADQRQVHRAADTSIAAPVAAGSSAPLPRLLIRHLLMPGHLDCCTRPVLRTVAQRWPAAAVNLMTGYLPFGKAARGLDGEGGLGGLNTEADRRAAASLAIALLPDVWIDGRPPVPGSMG